MGYNEDTVSRISDLSHKSRVEKTQNDTCKNKSLRNNENLHPNHSEAKDKMKESNEVNTKSKQQYNEETQEDVKEKSGCLSAETAPNKLPHENHFQKEHKLTGYSNTNIRIDKIQTNQKRSPNGHGKNPADDRATGNTSNESSSNQTVLKCAHGKNCQFSKQPPDTKQPNEKMLQVSGGRKVILCKRQQKVDILVQK